MHMWIRLHTVSFPVCSYAYQPSVVIFFFGGGADYLGCSPASSVGSRFAAHEQTRLCACTRTNEAPREPVHACAPPAPRPRALRAACTACSRWQRAPRPDALEDALCHMDWARRHTRHNSLVSGFGASRAGSTLPSLRKSNREIIK
mgnify:CR=1 FL=1